MKTYTSTEITTKVLEVLQDELYVTSGVLHIFKEDELYFVKAQLFYKMRNIIVFNLASGAFQFAVDSPYWEDLFTGTFDVGDPVVYYNTGAKLSMRLVPKPSTKASKRLDPVEMYRQQQYRS